MHSQPSKLSTHSPLPGQVGGIANSIKSLTVLLKASTAVRSAAQPKMLLRACLEMHTCNSSAGVPAGAAL